MRSSRIKTKPAVVAHTYISYVVNVWQVNTVVLDGILKLWNPAFENVINIYLLSRSKLQMKRYATLRKRSEQCDTHANISYTGITFINCVCVC